MGKSFSERNKIVNFAATIQKESINTELRTALWNTFSNHLNSSYTPGEASSFISSYRYANLLRHIQGEIFHRSVDELRHRTSDCINPFKIEFLVSAKWHTVYDMIEAHVQHAADSTRDKLITEYNRVLEKHGSAYRFIDTKLVEITSTEEINEVEQGINNSDGFPGVRIHLDTALSHLSDRTNPDYRNSIKESISAIESLCRDLLADPSITLGKAMNKIGDAIEIHPALASAFAKLYGYASDSAGIRHSIVDPEEKVDYFEAKFVFVTCCAFVNYIKGKQSNGRLELTTLRAANQS